MPFNLVILIFSTIKTDACQMTKIFLITDENIRHILIENYVLIYEIVEDEMCVRILRFRYAKMDLSKLTI